MSSLNDKKIVNDFNGWLVVNKEVGITSNRVNSIIKRKLHVSKSGFLGTLDPFASGVLPVAIGHATKILHYIDDTEKEYIAEIFWGKSTDSYDLTGKVIDENNKIPSKEDVENALLNFCGEISQVPPKFSAVKINGKRAYDLARKGIDVAIQPKIVTIHEIQLLNHENNLSLLKVKCSKGTYIRTLAVDIGNYLGCLCHLTKLTRTLSYKFDINNSISTENLLNISDNDVQCYIRPMDFVLDDIPALTVRSTEKFFNGMFEGCDFYDCNLVKVYFSARFIGLGRVNNNLLYPIRVFK